jgi:NADH-quinone oxidoreductase subunit N
MDGEETVTAPLIWIIIPGVVAVAGWIFRRYNRLSVILTAACSVFLALFAWLIEIGVPTSIGPIYFEINPEMAILGRRFILANSQRPLLVLIFALGAFWFLGARVAGTRLSFSSAGLAILSLMVAALAVEPFLYAALFIEVAVLLSVPLLITPGEPIRRGISRYLIFQTLALPFILVAGWASAGVELNPGNQLILALAVATLAFGFAFWLGVFPFYTWIPMIASHAPPFVAGFVLSIFPTFVFLLGLQYFNSFIWLRSVEQWQQILYLVGAVMVLTGGLWAVFQSNLARLLGYAVIIESGFSLLAISFSDARGYELFAQSILPRLVGLAVLSLALSIIKQKKLSFDLANLEGTLYQLPVASASVILALFSLGGMPLLAGFPIRLALLEKTAIDSLPLAIALFGGSVGLIIGGARALMAMAGGEKQPWNLGESRMQIILLAGGILFLFVMGILPQLILPRALGLLPAFSNLYPPLGQ